MNKTCQDNTVCKQEDSCAAVAPVFLEYEKQLKRFVKQRIKDSGSTDDVLQQLYLKLYKNCEQLQGVHNMNAWLYQITKNVVNDYFRESSKIVVLADNTEIADSDNQDLIKQEIEALVLPLIQLLPKEYAEALILSEIEGISQKEIAERLGISYSGAKSRVQRGREKLKQKFMECCVIELDRNGELINATVKDNCTPLKKELTGKV
jgi:RNA polymerase sigma-70 factor, ECF subfamily